MTAMETPSTIAAADLGSNSFRLQLGRVVDDQIYPLDSLREPVRLAAGLMTLARITGADVVPVVALSRQQRFAVHFGHRLPAVLGDQLLEQAVAELARFVREYPDEWWMWPYLERAT